MAEGQFRALRAAIDLEAVRHNVSLLRRIASPAALCAVVKADGYGHGAAEVGRACLDAGAAWLAVAITEEGVELRDAGIEAPILVLSEPDGEAMAEAVRSRLTCTVYTHEGLASLAAAADLSREPITAHVKVDTGMHRVGAPPAAAVELAADVARAPGLRLGGFWTHLAVAEDLDDGFTAEQLARFDTAVAELRRRGVAAELLHAANSAAAIAHPASRYDLVRCGLAVYGYGPTAHLADCVKVATGEMLRPVLSLRAEVSHVQRLSRGERISYGLRYQLGEPSVVATVPAGYADGVPRALGSAGGCVLVGGRRRPIAGTVTMDQLMVDCGPGDPVARGDEVVLLGKQGSEEVRADEWAELTGTISWEILTGIGPRVPRVVATPSVGPRS